MNKQYMSRKDIKDILCIVLCLPLMMGCIQQTTVDGVKHCVCQSSSDCAYGYDCMITDLHRGCFDYKTKTIVQCKPIGLCTKRPLYGG